MSKNGLIGDEEFPGNNGKNNECCLTDLQEEKWELKRELITCKKKFDHAVDCKLKAENETEKLRLNIAEMEKKREDDEKEKIGLKQKLNEQTEKIDQLLKKDEKLLNELSQAQKLNLELRNEIQECKTREKRVTDELNKTNELLQKKDKEKSDLEVVYQKDEGIITQLKEMSTKHALEKGELERKIAEVQKENLAQKDDLSVLQAKLAKKVHLLDEKNSKILRLKRNIEQRKQTIDSENIAIKHLTQQNANFERKIRELSLKCKSVQKTHEKDEEVIHQSMDEIEAFKMQVKTLSHQLEKAEIEKEKLIHLIQDCERQISELSAFSQMNMCQLNEISRIHFFSNMEILSTIYPNLNDMRARYIEALTVQKMLISDQKQEINSLYRRLRSKELETKELQERNLPSLSHTPRNKPVQNIGPWEKSVEPSDSFLATPIKSPKLKKKRKSPRKSSKVRNPSSPYAAGTISKSKRSAKDMKTVSLSPRPVSARIRSTPRKHFNFSPKAPHSARESKNRPNSARTIQQFQPPPRVTKPDFIRRFSSSHIENYRSNQNDTLFSMMKGFNDARTKQEKMISSIRNMDQYQRLLNLYNWDVENDNDLLKKTAKYQDKLFEQKVLSTFENSQHGSDLPEE